MSNWRQYKHQNFDDAIHETTSQTVEVAEPLLGGDVEFDSVNNDSENFDDSVFDFDYSSVKGDFKSSMKKINKNLEHKKTTKKIKSSPKFNKPLSQEIPIFNKADISGGRKQLKKVFVDRERDLIVQKVEKFMLSKDNDVDSYKQIGYYKGKKLKELIIVVENNTTIPFNLELFNPSMPLDYLHSTSNDLNARVTIGGGKNTDISYTDVLFNILANPTLIVNARLVAGGLTDQLVQNQLLQPLFFKNKNIEATEKIQPMQLSLHKDLMQTATDIVCFDIIHKLNRPFIPDGMDIVQYKVLAGATASFCFYYKQHSLKKFFFKEAKENKILI